MTLTTMRLRLRPFTEADAPALYQCSRDPKVGIAAGWPPHRSVEDSLEVIRTVFSAPHTFAVVERESGTLIGSAGFTGRGSPGEDELGYALHPDWWGQGLMTEAALELLRYAFEDRGLQAVWASHYAENPASRRVIEKCGFQRVSTETLMDETGEHETVFYRLDRARWEEAKG